MNFFKKGFTLAEVLITLAVIGIVAVLTIPVMTTKWQKRFYLTALRKKYAEFTQVLRLSTIENGTMSYWNWELDNKEFISKYIAPYFSQLNECENCWLSYAGITQGLFFEQAAEAALDPEYTCLDNAMKGEGNTSEFCQSVINTCIAHEGNWGDHAGGVDVLCASYYEYYLEQNSTVSEEPEITYTLADGTQLGVVINKSNQILYLYFDLNGAKKPNKYGADRYIFVVSANTISALGTGESDLAEGDYGCSDEGNKMYCGAMIIKNNWEYPDNYPNI